MFKHVFSPLFIKLYLAIIGAFIIAFILLLFVLDRQDEKTQVSDFVRDTDAIASILLRARSENPTYLKALTEVLEIHTGQTAGFYSSTGIKELLSGTEKIGRQHHATVYFDEVNDVFHAVYPVALSEEKLVVSDLPHLDLTEANSEAITKRIAQEKQEDVFIFQSVLGLILAFFLLSGLMLLMVMQSISKHIHSLAEASQSFAEGNLSLRLQTNIPAPLNVLASSFNTMAHKLEAVMQEQEVMSNAIAHELRTPLTRLQLAAGLASAKCDDVKIKGLIDSIDNNIDELDKLTNAVLTMARLNHRNTKALSMESIQFPKLVRERVAIADHPSIDIKLSIDINENVLVRGDELFLQMAIDNLISNALVYADSEIRVTLSYGSNQQLVLIVNDDGQGVPTNKSESIFLPFSRADESRDRKSGGFGLGLAIVNSVALAHGGNVTLGQGELSGAAFTLTLPIAT